jgi:hypothetical protein
VVIARDDTVAAVLRVNTGICQGVEHTYTAITLEDAASRDFTIAHEEDIMFGVIGRMGERDAMSVMVVHGNTRQALRDLAPGPRAAIQRYWQICAFPGHPDYLLSIVHDHKARKVCDWCVLAELRQLIRWPNSSHRISRKSVTPAPLLLTQNYRFSQDILRARNAIAL